ncbi:MAG: hypothetical protein IPL59_22375 [Candidatus Competibacteraceae bacterium]|nr:hypothetical protein [Candidatus Competibacteraceae bacterium]
MKAGARRQLPRPFSRELGRRRPAGPAPTRKPIWIGKGRLAATPPKNCASLRWKETRVQRHRRGLMRLLHDPVRVVVEHRDR